ncbi:uncharacterized protein LOC124909694 [Impatiens glandulifera]|uniref:uncharacterized protein LOC124909692 n=1 Tax=Impatiens glandulifera TaxID=253017 RepID=UPI001FB0FB35|nr:uncharacterized protein LOC124909692 [Impatiens glandulifera]XP_047306303.1 uncharacterized protein LOC124909694 [Impatiens glandulifera]
MCRGLQQQIIERDCLNIKAFYIRLSNINCINNNNNNNPLPDYLTLHYLPRINGNPLQIDGSYIRPDSPAFVTLHRVLSGEAVTYGSRERVRTSSGSRFEVYVKDEKFIKGIFRQGSELSREWKMECKCALEREMELGCFRGAEEAEVLIEGEGEEMKLTEKVDMVVRRRRKGRFNYCYRGCLEEIPEEEKETEPENEAAEGCCCCCSECFAAAAEGGGEDTVDFELEGVRKAVDVGFWVVCVGVGVGFLVSKASSRTFRKRMF